MNEFYDAICDNDIDAVEALIADGAKVNVKDYDGTPLHTAAWCGCTEIVKMLIDAGADVNAKNSYGNTPLDLAVRYGHADVVNLLIDAGADVNAKDLDAWTPLHVASLYGNIKIIKVLIDFGADVDAKDKYGWTPAHWAHGNEKIINLLLAAKK